MPTFPNLFFENKMICLSHLMSNAFVDKVSCQNVTISTRSAHTQVLHSLMLFEFFPHLPALSKCQSQLA